MRYGNNLVRSHIRISQRSRVTDICKKMIARKPQALPESRLKSETPQKGKLVTIPRRGLEQLMPDMDYHADDLETVRFAFLGSKRNPKVGLASRQREIKQALDPRNIMNPGKIFILPRTRGG